MVRSFFMRPETVRNKKKEGVCRGLSQTGGCSGSCCVRSWHGVAVYGFGRKGVHDGDGLPVQFGEQGAGGDAEGRQLGEDACFGGGVDQEGFRMNQAAVVPCMEGIGREEDEGALLPPDAFAVQGRVEVPDGAELFEEPDDVFRLVLLPDAGDATAQSDGVAGMPEVAFVETVQKGLYPGALFFAGRGVGAVLSVRCRQAAGFVQGQPFAVVIAEKAQKGVARRGQRGIVEPGHVFSGESLVGGIQFADAGDKGTFVIQIALHLHADFQEHQAEMDEVFQSGQRGIRQGGAVMVVRQAEQVYFSVSGGGLLAGEVEGDQRVFRHVQQPGRQAVVLHADEFFDGGGVVFEGGRIAADHFLIEKVFPVSPGFSLTDAVGLRQQGILFVGVSPVYGEAVFRRVAVSGTGFEAVDELADAFDGFHVFFLMCGVDGYSPIVIAGASVSPVCP